MSGGPFGGARVDLEICAGKGFAHELVYVLRDGTAPDLTGYTARIDVRTRSDVSPATPGTPIFQFRASPTGSQGTIAIGGTVTEELEDGTSVTGRLITLSAAASLTSGLAPTSGGREHVYDLELVNGTTVDPLASGYVTILPEVTR